MRRAALALAALALAVLAAAPARGRADTAPGGPVVGAINQAIRWYRQQQAEAELANDPSDVVYADAVRRQARDVLRLVFAWARAQAALEPATGAAGQAAPPAGGAEDLAARVDRAAAAASAATARVRTLEQALASAPPGRAGVLQEQVAEARSELALAEARRDTLRAFATFASRRGSGAAQGLLGQIEELERSVPEAAAAPSGSSAPNGPSSAAPARTASPALLRRAAPGGIVALASDAIALGRKLSVLHGGAALTTDLRAALGKLRAPLSAELRATLQQADALTAAPEPPAAAAIQDRTRQIQAVTRRFEGVSSALVPLGKANLLLGTHEATLSEWHDAVDAAWDADLRALALRLGLLAIAIAAVLAASAFWRSATLRYVHDLRRRQQLLVIRRVVVGTAIALMVVFSFATELGSLATFAGFITAGLAVALQNVILSVAGYFLLVGRYGVRVGDRVQVQGVTGDVVDVGVVRLQLVEVGPDGLPTGRVVAFTNAVLFQPGANFFKQIPGSSFAWHQIAFTLAPDTDYRHAEERLLAAVDQVYRGYEPAMAQQHARMSQHLAIAVAQPRPSSQLRLVQGGIEMTIRFPVPLERATEIDDRMTRAIVAGIEQEPRLELAGAAQPTLHAVPAPAGA